MKEVGSKLLVFGAEEHALWRAGRAGGRQGDDALDLVLGHAQEVHGRVPEIGGGGKGKLLEVFERRQADASRAERAAIEAASLLDSCQGLVQLGQLVGAQGVEVKRPASQADLGRDPGIQGRQWYLLHHFAGL
jgi:hypothetical protein